ncbi:MAG TPA: hypothetical protein VK989_10990 [Polyangia bacterium]|jgi:hypothetical protein|nr:hypothetical protein [Polyangia bacterium]
MRKRVRISSARGRAVPARSRMTVRRSEAPLVRGSQLAAALRSSREALTDLEGQLDALLAAVRGPAGALQSASDRVSGATREAGAALARLGTLARR